jgi:hypothetical protein
MRSNVTIQIHSRKNPLKGVKMTTAKWTIDTEEQQDLRYRAARFNEKGCLPVWGGDALRGGGGRGEVLPKEASLGTISGRHFFLGTPLASSSGATTTTLHEEKKQGCWKMGHELHCHPPRSFHIILYIH